MNTLVVYDITSNRIRGKIADSCLDYGMLRIQKSAFLGDMNRNRQDELMVRIRRIIEKKKGNVQMFSICDKDMKDRKETVNS